LRRMWATVASPSRCATAGPLGMASIACLRALWRQRHAMPVFGLPRPSLSASAHAKRPAVKGAGCQDGRSATLQRVCGVLGARLGTRCNVAGLALWLGVVIPPEPAVERCGKRAGGAQLLGCACGAQRRAIITCVFAGQPPVEPAAPAARVQCGHRVCEKALSCGQVSFLSRKVRLLGMTLDAHELSSAFGA